MRRLVILTTLFCLCLGSLGLSTALDAQPSMTFTSDPCAPVYKKKRRVSMTILGMIATAIVGAAGMYVSSGAGDGQVVESSS